MSSLKMIILSRRKPGMTKSEAQDYLYKVHGPLTKSPNPSEDPSKYSQFFFSDSASHSELDCHQSGWDLGGELYFESEEHLVRVLTSAWFQEKISPDNENFSKKNATQLYVAREKIIFGHEDIIDSSSTPDEAQTLAMYVIEAHSSGPGPDQIAEDFAATLRLDAADRVRALYLNIPLELSGAASGYKKKLAPGPLILGVYLEGPQAIPAFRAAQGRFERSFSHYLDIEKCQTIVGFRAIIYKKTV
ncbi:hypothetical protein FOYG_08976 [Fusarium oxysporum NRRL 32931]|uniref:EthD domain-containing protein n=1 Tax=Fusarium oxysporum NRRL 32931 TaxID=660029 RepID=W9IHU3_FUSOX|nr:hypothetical protein FOYG_08976 [Fusarium oxysporum NRRL 32931]